MTDCSSTFPKPGSLTQTTPDETRVPHFRHALAKERSTGPIFARGCAPLQEQGLLVKTGMIVA